MLREKPIWPAFKAGKAFDDRLMDMWGPATSTKQPKGRTNIRHLHDKNPSVSIAYGRSPYINSRVVEAPVPAYKELKQSLSSDSVLETKSYTKDVNNVHRADMVVDNNINKAAQDNRKKAFGEWVPISPTDTDVVEAAEFAVLEHNKLAKSNLKFDRVINGTTQVVGGTLYRLIIAAGSDNQLRDYLALVYVKPWQKFFKNLIKFTEI